MIAADADDNDNYDVVDADDIYDDDDDGGRGEGDQQQQQKSKATTATSDRERRSLAGRDVGVFWLSCRSLRSGSPHCSWLPLLWSSSLLLGDAIKQT